jgi:guanylate kinase
LSKIFVISGPSGSGKTTLLKKLLRGGPLKRKLVRSVSLTTRPRRNGERNGQDYFFISRQDFQKRRRERKILEWTSYLGHYYATPKDFVEKKVKSGKHILLWLDVRGARQIRKAYPQDSVLVFINPPSLKELQRRIHGRRHSAAEINQRLGLARQELAAARCYDYRLLNSDLSQAAASLRDIVSREISTLRR